MEPAAVVFTVPASPTPVPGATCYAAACTVSARDVLDAPGASASGLGGGRFWTPVSGAESLYGNRRTGSAPPATPPGYGTGSLSARYGPVGAGGRPRPQPRQEPRREPVERALLRLLIQARQFENLYSDSQNHPTFGPVFAQFRQEMVQAVRVLLFLLGSQGQ